VITAAPTNSMRALADFTMASLANTRARLSSERSVLCDRLGGSFRVQAPGPVYYVQSGAVEYVIQHTSVSMGPPRGLPPDPRRIGGRSSVNVTYCAFAPAQNPQVIRVSSRYRCEDPAEGMLNL
jgi:hypothetical protein